MGHKPQAAKGDFPVQTIDSVRELRIVGWSLPVSFKILEQPKMPARPKFFSAFTLIELLVVVAVIGILAALLLGSLSRAKATSQRVACTRNLQQLDLAMRFYAAENLGQFPPPGVSSQGWPEQLKLLTRSSAITLCPTDLAGLRTSESDLTHHRSYLMNGFADFYSSIWGVTQTVSVAKLGLPPIKDTDIKRSSETILFGEKASDSLAFELNLFKIDGSYLLDLAENRHGNVARTTRGGGANYAFADGSVRYLPWGKSTCPVNQWAIFDQWRNDSALCRAR